MTTIDLTPTEAALQVTVDLYRDIHKAIRVELFDVTARAGRMDPGVGADRAALAAHVRDLVQLLVEHAEHEDGAIQPVLEAELPDLAEKIERDHLHLDARMDGLVELAAEAAALEAPAPGRRVHRLYLALADFTSDYLRHQDVEERVVMPALERAVGVDAVLGIHAAILAGIPPEQMARSLSLMFPAMNVEDRTGMLGGMRADAPPEVFEGVWRLVETVLEPTDVAEVARRLALPA